MSVLKKFDLFKSINPEHKDGTLLGTVLTFISVTFIVFFFTKEIHEYRSQKLTTKLYVSDYADTIDLFFDISFQKIPCNTLHIDLQKGEAEPKIKKKNVKEGCRATGNITLEPTDNELSFKTDYGSTMIDLMQNLHIQIMNPDETKNIDFSHNIHKFQFGPSTRNIKSLEAKFPDMIKANPLEKVFYASQSIEDGHSLFLYELNVVNANVSHRREVIYNYHRNTINTMDAQPYVNFKLNFSPIGVEYIEGNENFWEFMTYLLGVVGGILSIIKFSANIIAGIIRPKQGGEAMPN